MGSLMHNQFHSSTGNIHPAQLLGRVFLQQAHVTCLGSSRDQRLIEEVVHILRHVVGHRACNVQEEQHNTSLHRAQTHEDATIHEAGRELNTVALAELHTFCPPELTTLNTSHHVRDLRSTDHADFVHSSMPAKLAAVVKSIVSKSNVVSGLPQSMRMASRAKKSPTVSVVSGGLREWWQSEDGKKWMSKMKDIYGD